MGLYLEIKDNDAAFAMLSTPATIINYVRDTTADEKKAFNELIYSMFEGDVMDNIPTCGCTMPTVGRCNLGVICKNCGQPVRAQNATGIESLLWIQTPEGCAPMINPGVLDKLSKHFTRNNFNIIRYLIDTSYRVECKIPGLLLYLEEKGIKPNYRYFYENYDYVITTLLEHKLFRRKRNQVEENAIEIFLRMYRSVTFCDHVPLPNKTMLVIEENATGVYREKSIEKSIDAMRTVAGIDLAVKGLKPRIKENRIVKALFLLIDFVDEYINDCVRGKSGAIRKQVIAARSHFSYRAVIVSITDPHDYEALYMPWTAATSMLRLHLANKLKKLGMTQREAVAFIDEHAQKYHPLLDRLFKELIAESPYKGIPCLFVRNPSQMRGSIQRFFITQVKTDPTDPTTSISVLAISSPNADFDGDACAVMMLMDNQMTELMYAFAPHQNVLDVGEYRQMTSAMVITKPVTSSINHWYRLGEEEEPSQEQLDYTMSLAMTDD